jgi:type VI secretion system protein ImpH
VKAPTAVWFNEDAPWDAGFLSLMRCIAARHPDMPPPGTASLPGEENFRIGQVPSLAFSPREIAGLSERDGTLCIDLFGLGLWGSQGPLPLHLTELAYSRAEAQQDRTLIEFVNIFHHRALAMFYRAWAGSQSTASFDRDDEPFSLYIGSIAGLDPLEARASELPLHARLAAAPHLVREARNPDGMSSTIAHYFDVPVSIEEWLPTWIELADSQCTRLGHAGPPSVLGDGALLGTFIHDRQHSFRLIVGPLDLDRYLDFMPGTPALAAMTEWVRAFVGFEYAWELQLLIKPHAAPPARADDAQRLGHSTWLGEANDDAPVCGMVFEPELYL